MSRPDEAKRYWNRNIANWGKLYLDASHSHEVFDSPTWLSHLYRLFIIPIESRLMAKRYRLTMDFIERHVAPGNTAIDLGCGTGIFTVAMLKRGARVLAVDIAQSSLDATREAVAALAPEHRDKVEYHLLDASRDRLPQSDVALAMGITPYITDLSAFYTNVLPGTKLLCCLIIDPRHWANRVRQLLPILNVRRIHWFEKDLVDTLLQAHQWGLISRSDFASGYIDIAARRQDDRRRLP